jgi:hypothetical protein
VQIREHHPVDKRRPLIDFSLVLLLLPPILIGTILGVVLNSVSPTWLVIAIIFVVLTFVSYETLKKALVLRKQERKPPSLLPDNVSQPIATQPPQTDTSHHSTAEPGALQLRIDRASMSSQRNNESTTEDVSDAAPQAEPTSPGGPRDLSAHSYHLFPAQQEHADEAKTTESSFPSSSTDYATESEADSAHIEGDRSDLLPRMRIDTVVRSKAAKAFYSPFLDTITGAQARQLLLDGDMRSGDLTKTQQSSVLEGILAAEARFPLVPILWTFALLTFVVILSLIRGGQSGESLLVARARARVCVCVCVCVCVFVCDVVCLLAADDPDACLQSMLLTEVVCIRFDFLALPPLFERAR